MDRIEVVLGIDVGGTNTVLGLIDSAGCCHLKIEIPTNGSLPAESLFDRLFDCFKDKFNSLSSKYELLGFGIGAPTANYFRGTVENPNNLNWGHVNIIDIIKKYYDLPVIVINDADAAAVGEMKFGVAKGMKNFIEITLGTGLGSGVVINGELIHGQSGFAGEIGHTIVVENGRCCGCGRKGCLETYVSANGIRRTVFELISWSNEASSLRDYSYNSLSAKIIYEAALNNDPIANMAFDLTGRKLGFALANSAAHLDPEAFILFGGLALSGDLLLKPVKYYLEENLLGLYKGKIKVIQSGLMNSENAAILGAAAVIWHELKTVEINY